MSETQSHKSVTESVLGVASLNVWFDRRCLAIQQEFTSGFSHLVQRAFRRAERNAS